jgi:hypothetical protein
MKLTCTRIGRAGKRQQSSPKPAEEAAPPSAPVHPHQSAIEWARQRMAQSFQRGADSVFTPKSFGALRALLAAAES